jgi:hypothetical protein
MQRLRCTGLTVLLALIAVAVLGVGSAGAGQAATPSKTCFWSDAVVSPYTDPATNVDFPDTNAAYWYTKYQLPAGGKVVLRGTYPYARYISLVAYRSVAGSPGSPTEGINDQEMAPDPGSANPFLAGASRLTLPQKRKFTVTLSGDAPPAAGTPRDANTLYTGTADGAGTTQTIEVIYRVYVPNALADATGDAGLPVPTYVPAGGPGLTGQAACDSLQTGTARIPDVLGPVFGPVYPTLLGLSPLATHPAVSPQKWYAFFNAKRLLEPFYAGTPAAGAIASLPTAKTGGAYSNRDNSYVYSYVDRSFGPNPSGHNVLVLHGKIPTTPSTVLWNPKAQGDTQMRYWSLCQNETLPSGKVSTPCLYDQQVPRTGAGFYTVVVGMPDDRPVNARPGCGVAWLDWGTTGDGFGRTTAGLLILRNMLPDPSFTQAPANVMVPGTEKQVMGDYLPDGSYQSKAQFEATGCGHRG